MRIRKIRRDMTFDVIANYYVQFYHTIQTASLGDPWQKYAYEDLANWFLDMQRFPQSKKERWRYINTKIEMMRHTFSKSEACRNIYAEAVILFERININISPTTMKGNHLW